MSDHCIYREKTEYCPATCPCLGVEQVTGLPYCYFFKEYLHSEKITIFKMSDKCKKQMESEKITVFKCCNKYKKPNEEKQ